MRLFLSGVVVGLIVGVGLTTLYFSLATFFTAIAKVPIAQDRLEETYSDLQGTKEPAEKAKTVGA